MLINLYQRKKKTIYISKLHLTIYTQISRISINLCKELILWFLKGNCIVLFFFLWLNVFYYYYFFGRGDALKTREPINLKYKTCYRRTE